MCGICGEVRFDGAAASLDAVGRAAARLAGRGPDAAGVVAHDQAAFAQRRLKIIDLSDKAQQPMVDPHLGLMIVFNGCIYNHRELRSELEGLGYRFFSAGDTEVVLKAYHAWGADCVRRFNGMFAFAVHERDSGRLVLARDRLGIKPLYLVHEPGARRVRFASTLPALLAAGDVDTSIDAVALHHYMSFHAVVPAPFTILNGVKKLPPATIATFDADGERSNQVYWQLAFERDADDLERGADDWRDLLTAALRRAVERRMIADVPVGVLLSGGVDSSLIVAMLSRSGQDGLKTFSIGFESVGDEIGNEFRYSDMVAERHATEHHRIVVDSERLPEVLPGTFEAMSEPMVSHDNVGFYLLSQEVSNHVKVVQSGQGADEVFGGYHWYPPLEHSNDPARDYAKVFFDRPHDELALAVDPELVDDDYSKAFVAGAFALPGADEAIDKALRLDTTVMLVDDPVKRVDNMTMAWGLEARVPFLDHELVELAARVPPAHKIRDDGKGILKDVARDFLPDEVIDRPKGYFPVPALKHLQGPVLDLVFETLTGTTARQRGLFRERYVAQLLNHPGDHMTPLGGSKLWQLASLEMWLQANDL